MTILVSDTSVLIDLERGELISCAFKLSATFAVPDVLYERELRDYGGEELGSSCQGVAHHGSSGIGYQVRQDRAIQPGYAGSPRIAGGTQAQTKTSKVRSGEVNNDREEINGCAETATPDRTQGHSRIRKMAEGKSGKPGRAEVTRRTCDGDR